MTQPYAGAEPYCFVSYSHKDLALAESWLDGLAARGCRIWFDEGINPGTEWAEGIAEHLEGASGYVVLLSPNAADSVYVRSEISRAIELKKEILCVYLQPCELSGGLKLQLGIYRAVHAWQHRDLQSALEKVCAALPAEVREAVSDLPPANREQTPTGKKSGRPALWIGLVLLAAALAFFLWNRYAREEADPEEPVEEATPSPTEEPTPEPEASPGPTPEKKPGDDDIRQTGSMVEYPRASEYYETYRHAVVKAPRGHSIYGYDTAEHDGGSFTVLDGEVVTVLAERGGWACVIVPSTNMALWVNMEHLVMQEP